MLQCPLENEEIALNFQVRKKSSTVRVVRHWNRLDRDVVDAPSMETFKVRLGENMGNLI